MADMNRLRLCSERGEIAAGVDQAARDTKSAQGIDRAIDREALGDPAEVDCDPGMAKANAVAREQLDRCYVFL